MPVDHISQNNQRSDLILRYAEEHSSDYAYTSAPRSPHAELTGNTIPNVTRLAWLKSRNKCNQFVGDVLTSLGVAMPMFRMKDNSKHYVHAEALARYTTHFHEVAEPQHIEVGDLLVSDNLRVSGENGAHVELVASRSRDSIQVVGATKKGVVSEFRHLSALHSTNTHDIRILRPLQWIQARDSQ